MEVADDVRHEIGKRAAALVRAGRLTRDEGVGLAGRALRLFVAAVAVAPRTAYAPLEGEARARIEDPRDWSPVALALALDGGIWAEDRHFCGSGGPVWSTRVPVAHLALP